MNRSGYRNGKRRWRCVIRKREQNARHYRRYAEHHRMRAAMRELAGSFSALIGLISRIDNTTDIIDDGEVHGTTKNQDRR